MAIYECVSTYGRRYLMKLSKIDLVREVEWRHNAISRLHRAILDYGRHKADCTSKRRGGDCDCGFDDIHEDAEDWFNA